MAEKYFDPYDFSKKEVNDTTVYYKYLPSAPSVQVRVVFTVGAFNDPVGKEGLSHFFEHLIFNGSPKLQDKKAIREWSKQVALNTWNANTSFYSTVFHLKCLPEKYDEALLGMKDMIFYSYLKQEDVEHERKIITQEAWQRFQNEKLLAYNKEISGQIFHGHQHARFMSALGWPETIAAVTREDIVDFHKAYYGIGNFFIVLVGAVEERHITQLELFLKDLPHVRVRSADSGKIHPPKEKRYLKSGDEIGEIKEQVEITVSRAAEAVPYQKNEIVTLSGRLLNDLLHERLRVDHSLCYSVAVAMILEKTYSQFAMNVKTDEKNISLVEKEFENILLEIRQGKYTDRFELLKRVYTDQIRSQEFLSTDIANISLREIIKFDGRIITSAEQLLNIDAATYDDITAFLDWAFLPEYLHTEVILPSKK